MTHTLTEFSTSGRKKKLPCSSGSERSVLWMRNLGKIIISSMAVCVIPRTVAQYHLTCIIIRLSSCDSLAQLLHQATEYIPNLNVKI